MKLLPLDGDFVLDDNNALFTGGFLEPPADRQDASSTTPRLSKSGLLGSDTMLSEGSVTATFRFEPTVAESNVGADIVLLREQVPRISLAVGVANRPHAVFAIRQWEDTGPQVPGMGTRGQFNYRYIAGSLSAFEPDRDYHVEMKIAGSRVFMVVGGVPVGVADLSSALSGPLQVGIWCWSSAAINISDVSTAARQPKAFIVMPFDGAFDAIYKQVIKPICEKQFQIVAVRGDEMYGPGVIVKDIIEQVNDAQLIIADISAQRRGTVDHPSHNPNVFFEVGYAMALGKPTILMAKRTGDELPFDVSGFRVLFYEDSIAGKSLVEEQLTKHLAAITGRPPADNSAEHQDGKTTHKRRRPRRRRRV